MSRRGTAVAMGFVMLLTLTGIAGAAKPLEIVAATKFYFFLDGAGKVPKKDSHSVVVLKDYNAPVYYCWFAFQDFANQNKGKSTARITVFHADDTEERSPKLGGRIKAGEVFDCAFSFTPLEAGSLVAVQATNKSLKGGQFDEFAGQLEIYSEIDPLNPASATALGRADAVMRPESLEMRPVE